MSPNDYFQAMTFIAPALCSTVCALFVGLLMSDHRNSRERGGRILVFATFVVISVLWLLPMLSGWRPVTATLKIALTVAALTLPAAQLWLTWRIIRRVSVGPIGRQFENHTANAPRNTLWPDPDSNPADLAYPTDPDITDPDITVRATNPAAPQPEFHGELTRRNIEEYFARHRPWLDPDFKLTDLADAMGANRSEMSAFVNRTFGIGFKRYVNRWRLAEYERLMALPSGELKNPYRVIKMAGFSDARHYHRVAEQERAHTHSPTHGRP